MPRHLKADHGPVLRFYAVATSDAEWQQLVPLVVGRRRRDADDLPGADVRTLATGPGRGAAHLARLPSRRALRRTARDRLTRAAGPRRPRATRRHPAPAVLPNLPTAPAIHRGRAPRVPSCPRGPRPKHAEATLRVLRDHLLLDTLNLHFLDVQLHPALGEWTSLAARPYFASLADTPRPPAVTAAMVEALVRTRVLDAPTPDVEDLDQVGARPLPAAGAAGKRVAVRFVTASALFPAVGTGSSSTRSSPLRAARAAPALLDYLDTAAAVWPRAERALFDRLRALVPRPAPATPVLEIDFQHLSLVGMPTGRRPLRARRPCSGRHSTSRGWTPVVWPSTTWPGWAPQREVLKATPAYTLTWDSVSRFAPRASFPTRGSSGSARFPG